MESLLELYITFDSTYSLSPNYIAWINILQAILKYNAQ